MGRVGVGGATRGGGAELTGRFLTGVVDSRDGGLNRVMLTLAIDTSTSEGRIALMRGEEVFWEERFGADRSHSAALFPLIERAVRDGGDDLARVVVGVGPGSYAGIRVSIAAALGLAFTRGVELVGVVSLAALRPISCEPYLAFGDARRGTWYWCLVCEGRCVDGPEVISDEEFRVRWDRAGDVPRISTRAEAGWSSEVVLAPSASVLGMIAERGGAVVQRGALEPLYLREPHITQPGRRAAVFGRFGTGPTDSR